MSITYPPEMLPTSEDGEVYLCPDHESDTKCERCKPMTMRLEKHDEIVEAIWNALSELDDNSTNVKRSEVALDAMLEAVVKLEVGKEAAGTYGHPANGEVWMSSTHWNSRPTHPDYFPALILKLEPKP
jgi:hypothetical protein